VPIIIPTIGQRQAELWAGYGDASAQGHGGKQLLSFWAEAQEL